MPDNTMIDTTATTTTTATPAVAVPASPAPSPDARAAAATAPPSGDHDSAPASTDPAPSAADGATEGTPAAEQTQTARSRNGKRPGTGGRRRTDGSSATTPKTHRARPATSGAQGAGSEEDPTADTADPSGDVIGEQVQDRLWAALRAHPAATAAELATHARISRTKANTLLAAWAADGSVTAAPGTTPRAARRWTATETPATAPADTSSPAGSRRPDPTEQTDPEPATGPVTAQPDAPSTDEPDTWPPTADAPRRTPSRNRSGSVRLAAGALRGLVEEYLTDHPGEHGPVEIGRAIGRSSGAVANALERLVADGWAERTGDRPKRYRTADTGDNTTGLTSTGPAGAAGPSGAATADSAGDEPTFGGAASSEAIAAAGEPE